MQVVINGLNLGIESSDRVYAEKRLRSALGRFADRLSRVTLILEDVNGPRGGADKEGRLLVQLKRGAPIAVSVAAISLRHAIDLAAARAKRSVSRMSDRLTRRRRKGRSIGSMAVDESGDV